VPGLIETHLRPWVTEWLGNNGLAIEQVGSWAIHPGGPRIVDSVARSLGIAESLTKVSDEVLADFGNMSSPTVVFILDRLRKSGAKRPCVAMAFGPGLMVEAALVV
jgi:predicted naringenin-chalcone synthase